MLHSCSISNQSFSNKRATGELFCLEAIDANTGERGTARGVRVRGGVRGGGEQGQGEPYSNLWWESSHMLGDTSLATRENMACDVDEVLWPDQNRTNFLFLCCTCRSLIFFFHCLFCMKSTLQIHLCLLRYIQYFRINSILVFVFYIWVWKQATVRIECSVTLKMQKAYW